MTRERDGFLARISEWTASWRLPQMRANVTRSAETVRLIDPPPRKLEHPYTEHVVRTQVTSPSRGAAATQAIRRSAFINAHYFSNSMMRATLSTNASSWPKRSNR